MYFDDQNRFIWKGQWFYQAIFFPRDNCPQTYAVLCDCIASIGMLQHMHIVSFSNFVLKEGGIRNWDLSLSHSIQCPVVSIKKKKSLKQHLHISKLKKIRYRRDKVMLTFPKLTVCNSTLRSAVISYIGVNGRAPLTVRGGLWPCGRPVSHVHKFVCVLFGQGCKKSTCRPTPLSG